MISCELSLFCIISVFLMKFSSQQRVMQETHENLSNTITYSINAGIEFTNHKFSKYDLKRIIFCLPNDNKVTYGFYTADVTSSGFTHVVKTDTVIYSKNVISATAGIFLNSSNFISFISTGTLSNRMGILDYNVKTNTIALIDNIFVAKTGFWATVEGIALISNTQQIAVGAMYYSKYFLL